MRFSFLNIPVNIHFSFWIFLIFFVRTSSSPAEMVIYSLVLFISLIVHEYGHGLTALYFGKDPKIDLLAFGGYTTYRDFGLSEKQKFLITLNGPLFEAFLILFAYILLRANIFQSSYILYFLYILVKFNIFWCLVNLVPLYPLDGGHLLRQLLEKKFGEKGFKISLIIGNISAILGCLFFFWHQYFGFAIIFAIYGFQNMQMSFKNLKLKQNNFGLYNDGVRSMENNDNEKAKAIFKKLLKTKDKYIKVSAAESLAIILHQENDPKGAYNLLLKTDHSRLKKGKCLLCKLAYDEKNYVLAKKYSDEIYEIDGSFEIALLNSKVFAGLNEPEYSGGWLRTASLFDQASKETLKEILQDKIYDSVKENDSFKKQTQKIY
ncbi:MAG: M50 family metallopeptidase [Chlamydiae bacterium]|nr:M50 family metallopeptidase [Chlamydiota bacterium]